ncbi:MAG: alginate export family protein [Porticoccaceae bacterium]
MANLQRIISTALAASTFTATAHAETDFWQALSNGMVTGGFRVRSESADDSLNKDAHALTLRSRLSYHSADYRGFSGALEFDDIRVVAGQDRYSPQNSGFAQIADPEISELNQAFIRYRASPGLNISVGRQRILLDNQRFVGASAWRQDDQTFDALNIDYTYQKFKMTYAYIDNINGVTPAADASVSHHIANLGYSWSPAVATVLYGYQLDADQALSLAASDSRTLGLRVTGKVARKKLALDYAAEFARQNAGPYDTEYLLTELSATIDVCKLTFGYENLGSDKGAYGFQTPLATLHAFNGWADKFGFIPNSGLQDRYVKAGISVFASELKLAYHSFKADEGGGHYGDEFNAMAGYTINKNLSAGIKYAAYRADDFSADTEKFWLWAEMTF